MAGHASTRTTTNGSCLASSFPDLPGAQRRDELRAHRLGQETDRQQALGDDEVVEGLAVELVAQRQLGLGPEVDQQRVAVIIAACLSRRAERAAFAQIEGKPGAAGAALSVLRRGWILKDEPVAVNPRTQDAVFRAIGRPGIVLVAEGPVSRVKQLVNAERVKMNRIVPGVPVQVVHAGNGEGQVPLQRISKTLQKMKKNLTKQEVSAVDKRLSALGPRMPIPKGVDPFKARPDRKAMRGR